MRLLLRLLSLMLLGNLVTSSSVRAAAPPREAPRTRETIEAATRLQVFLDRANFAPGKIDGRYGEFTLQALALYRAANGAPPAPNSPNSPNSPSGPTPDVTGLDLASVDPVFIEYTVAPGDLAAVGEMASGIAAQARQKSLPYQSAAEAIAERFHMDVDFLAELNPGKTKRVEAGAVLIVANVEPFELTAVKDILPGSEIASNEVDEPVDGLKSPDDKPADAPVNPPAVAVRVDTSRNMLTVFEAEKLVAAYPVTIGSAQTSSPIGEWKVRGVAKMPNFRYDRAMLMRGERSGDYHILPPGPNNPVGVIWIQLNKKGIGLHGTSDPDQIGRNASHGCVRLANWDIVRLAKKVKPGVPVSIR